MIGSSMMSSSNGEVVVGVDNTYLCASCGITESDDVKLKICTACKLTRYCSVACQKLHRPQHKVECRKRAAELRDDQLFTQPDGTHLGECPICLLPQPLNGPTHQKSGLMSCCSQLICKGCAHANKLRELEEGLEPKCAFCRQGLPRTESEADANRRKRMKAGDAVAIREIGARLYNMGDYRGAFEYWTKAVGLTGDAKSHYQLSDSYRRGRGVEKDVRKEIYHLEEAAIRGHVVARFNLGCYEQEKGRIDRAVKHWIIAAIHGDDGAMKLLRDLYASGHVLKEELEATLRAHHAAVDAAKSPQRDVVDAPGFLELDSRNWASWASRQR
jgi:tetratricopeptide (TPR) repeat protein